MQIVKQEVYALTSTSCTKQLRRERPKLTEKRDLRYKAEWAAILESLKSLRASGKDLSLEDLERSESLLRESFFRVERVTGKSDEKIEIDWQRIALSARFSDVHIEELL